MERKRPLVVCVDDDPRVLDALRRELRSEDLEFRSTTDPRQVLAWLQDDPDLVISDERMPEICGSVLLHQVHERSPRTARLVLTAYPEDVSERGVRMLTKPWTAAELRFAIRELVERVVVLDCRGRAAEELLRDLDLGDGRRVAFDLRHLHELRGSIPKFLRGLIRAAGEAGYRVALRDPSGLADTMCSALRITNTDDTA